MTDYVPRPNEEAELPLLAKRQFGEKPSTFYHGSYDQYKVGDIIPSGFSGTERDFYGQNRHYDNPTDALAHLRSIPLAKAGYDNPGTVYATQAIGTTYPDRKAAHETGQQWRTGKGFRVTGIVHRDSKEYIDHLNKHLDSLSTRSHVADGYADRMADRG